MGDEEPASKADLNHLMTQMEAMMGAIENQKIQLDALTSGTSSTTPPTPVETLDKDKPLTRCHSASSLFSAVFVFQKSYTGNILRIGRNKSQTSRYFTELPEHRRGDGAGPEGGHTTRGRGPPLARIGLWCGPPGPLLTTPLRL
jgi:hypothetical protein